MAVAVLRDKFAGHPAVEIRHADYLESGLGALDCEVELTVRPVG